MALETGMEMGNYVNSPADEGRQSLEKTENCLSGVTVYKVIGISFGLLCIIQFALNVSLRVQGTGSCNSSDRDNINSTNVTLMSQRDILALIEEKNNIAYENSYLCRVKEILNEKLDQQEKVMTQLRLENERLKSALSTPAKQNIQSCPVGWKRNKLSCYQLSSERKGWGNAKKDCLAKRAHLVILNDQVEEAFLQTFGRFTVWIGLSSQENGPQKTWTWVDRSQLTYRNKNNWLQSDGQLLNCVYAELSLINWVPASCREQHNWVCEKELW